MSLAKSDTIQGFLESDLAMNKHRAAVRIKIIVTMILLTIIDIGPVPITAVIGLYVAIFRPHWFINLVDDLYNRML